MADKEVTVRLSIEADKAGADETKAALASTGDAAQKAADKSKSAFSGFSATVSSLKKVLAGVAAVAGVSALIASVKNIADSFSHAQKQAEKFQKIQEELASSSALKNLENAYSRIKDSVAQAAQAVQNAFEIQDAKTANSRRLEDANANAALQSELAALDPNDPHYAEQRAAIEAKYSAQAADRNASRAREDVISSQAKARSDASALDDQATAQAAQSDFIKAAIAKAQRDLASANHDSVSLNDADKNGFWDAFGSNVKQIISGQWGRLGDDRTAEGDQIRLDAAQKAADAQKRIQDLEEQLRQSQEREASLRSQASHKRSLADEMDNTLAAVDVENAVHRAAGAMQVDSANSALSNAYSKDADAKQAVANLSIEQQRLKDSIAAQNALKDSASFQVFKAQQSGSSTSLIQAKEAAFNVNASADAAIQALTKALNDVTSKLNAAKSYLDQQASRSSYAWSDSPAAS